MCTTNVARHVFFRQSISSIHSNVPSIPRHPIQPPIYLPRRLPLQLSGVPFSGARWPIQKPCSLVSVEYVRDRCYTQGPWITELWNDKFDCHFVATMDNSFVLITNWNEVTAMDRGCAECFSGVLKKEKKERMGGKEKKGKGIEEEENEIIYYCSVEMSYTHILTGR